MEEKNVEIHVNDGFRYPATVKKNLAHHTGEEVITTFYHQGKAFYVLMSKNMFH